MQSQVRKQMYLRSVPTKKKTSKKLKTTVHADLEYYTKGSTSLPPQKKNTLNDTSTFHKREKSPINKATIERKNKSLTAKYHSTTYYPATYQSAVDNSVVNPVEQNKGEKTTDKFTKTNEKYSRLQLQTLDQILKKKDSSSNKIIRQNFANKKESAESKSSLADYNYATDNTKTKGKITNIKHIFENRKLTSMKKDSGNLRRLHSRSNSKHTSTINQQRQKQKCHSNDKRMEAQLEWRKEHRKSSQSQRQQRQRSSKLLKAYQDIDLSHYMVDPDIYTCSSSSSSLKVENLSLQNLYQQAQKLFNFYNAEKDYSSGKQLCQQNLRQCLRSLLVIEKSIGNRSKKTLLLLGKVYYEMRQYNDCIRYIDSVMKMKEVEYDLGRISSMKERLGLGLEKGLQWGLGQSNMFQKQKQKKQQRQGLQVQNPTRQNPKKQSSSSTMQMMSFVPFSDPSVNSLAFSSASAYPHQGLMIISSFYVCLSESFKQTQNFLCALKVLNEWQTHVVKASLINYEAQRKPQPQQKQRQSSFLINKGSFNHYQYHQTKHHHQHIKKNSEIISNSNLMRMMAGVGQEKLHDQQASGSLLQPPQHKFSYYEYQIPKSSVDQSFPKDKKHSFVSSVGYNKRSHTQAVREINAGIETVAEGGDKIHQQHQQLQLQLPNNTQMQRQRRRKSSSKSKIALISDAVDVNDDDYHSKNPKYSLNPKSQQPQPQPLLSRFPFKLSFLQGYLLKARVHYEAKDYDDAINSYVCAVVCNPMHLQASLELAMLYYQKKEWSRCLAMLQNVIAENSFDAIDKPKSKEKERSKEKEVGSGGIRLKSASSKAKRPTTANQRVKASSQQLKQQRLRRLDYALYHMGVVYFKLNRLSEAISVFDRLQNEQNGLLTCSKELISPVMFYKGCALLRRRSGMVEGGMGERERKQTRTRMENSSTEFHFDLNTLNKKPQLILDQAMLSMQKCIDYQTSEYYVACAYCMRIYILIFYMKDYYGAQYQIDRFKVVGSMATRMRRADNSNDNSKRKGKGKGKNQNKMKNLETKSYQDQELNMEKQQSGTKSPTAFLENVYNSNQTKVNNILHSQQPRGQPQQQKLTFQHNPPVPSHHQAIDFNQIYVICGNNHDKLSQNEEDSKTNQHRSYHDQHSEYSISQLIVLTDAIICILKMKLKKGLATLIGLQNKIRSLSSLSLHSPSASLSPSSFYKTPKHTSYLEQIQTLISQFKYYAYYASRRYPEALLCIENGILSVGELGSRPSYGLRLGLLSSPKKKPQRQIKTAITPQPQLKLSPMDLLNYLTLKAIICIQNQNFDEAINLLNRVDEISAKEAKSAKKGFCPGSSPGPGSNSNSNYTPNSKPNSPHPSSSSYSPHPPLIAEYRKDHTYHHEIRAMCYILFYKYLKDNDSDNDDDDQEQKEKIGKQNQEHKRKKDQKKNESHPSQALHPNPNYEILLSSQHILSQCLIQDKQNFQIQYLIAVIHYQLGRLESSLNYIRQAIEFSDDHMIKHYYLKANAKLLLGRFDQAVKDYCNGVTVWKEIQKEKEELGKAIGTGVCVGVSEVMKVNSPSCVPNLSLNPNHKQFKQNLKRQSNNSKLAQEDDNEENFEGYEDYQSDDILSPSIINPTTDPYQGCSLATSQQEEYYEEQQVMIDEIYLNRAIAYLKYAYALTAQSKYQYQKYEESRCHIISCKELAGEDLFRYFKGLLAKIRQIKKRNNLRERKNETIHQIDAKLSHHKDKLQKQKQHKQQQCQQQQLQQIQQYLLHQNQPQKHFLQLILHTNSNIESFLQISKEFLQEGYRLIDDQDLLVYFYLAKELNNCLSVMEKMIKKHYLAKQKQGALSSYQQSNKKNLSPNKQQRLSFDKKILSALKDSSSNQKDCYENALVNLLQVAQILQMNQKSTKIKMKKTNAENAEDNQSFRNPLFKQDKQKKRHIVQGGYIFDKSDLIFFIGVMYYLIQNYGKALDYFTESLEEKRKNGQLYSLKNLIFSNKDIDGESGQEEEEYDGQDESQINSKNNPLQNAYYNQRLVSPTSISQLQSQQQHLAPRALAPSYQSESPQKESQPNFSSRTTQRYEYHHSNHHYYDFKHHHSIKQHFSSKPQLQFNSSVKQFAELFQNRTYSKEQIEYNIGVLHLLNGDMPKAYKYLKVYPGFVDLFEKLMERGVVSHENAEQVQEENEQEEQEDKQSHQSKDITPFPVHNRLCSIYSPKKISNKQFMLSFCLPKIQLPLGMGLFYESQVEMAAIQITADKKARSKGSDGKDKNKKAGKSNKMEKDNKMEKNDETLLTCKADNNKIQKRNNQKDQSYCQGQHEGQSQQQQGENDFDDKNQDDQERGEGTQQYATSSKPSIKKYLIQNANLIPDILNSVSLNDIQIKPMAPWIKKDSKGVRFTDNFLFEQQPFDLLKTERGMTTRREKPNQQSSKHMFSKKSHEVDIADKNKGLTDRDQDNALTNDEKPYYVQLQGEGTCKREGALRKRERNNKLTKLQMMEMKKKSRRYDTIAHEEDDDYDGDQEQDQCDQLFYEENNIQQLAKGKNKSKW